MTAASAAPLEPVPAATVVLLRDGAGGLEVLLLERSAGSRVLAGTHVFPGGKLDAGDADPARLSQAGAPLATLHAALGEPKLDPATAGGLFVAAARETYEETGVLLARTDGSRSQPASRLRDQPFWDTLAAGEMSIDWSALVPWSRWITPVAPHFFRGRFDARFFLAALPERQVAVHDAHEAVASTWVAPAAALADWWEGSLRLVPAQIMSLAALARFDSTAEAIGEASRRRPPTIAMESVMHGMLPAVVLPGDPRHTLREPVMTGPSLLVLRNGRFEPDGGLEALLPRVSRRRSGGR